MARERACSLEQFQKDTAEHVMSVQLNLGMHRHLRFRKPGTNGYSFDIITWPGYLAISGDMGASVFSRLPDMFEFFRAPETWVRDNPGKLGINARYWSEKIVANDGPKEAFDRARLEQIVKERYDEFMTEQPDDAVQAEQEEADLWNALRDDVLCAENTYDAIDRMTHFEYEAGAFSKFTFTDAWEYGSSLEEPTFHLVWRLYAIAHAVLAYDAWKAEQPAVAVPAEA